jgi:hypothetical protein
MDRERRKRPSPPREEFIDPTLYYRCNMPGCKWKLDRASHQPFEAYAEFGEHNKASHGGTLSAEIIKPPHR